MNDLIWSRKPIWYISFLAMNIFSYMSSFISHKQCFWCKNQEHFFCPKCSDVLEIYKPYCYVCKKLSEEFYTHEKCKKHFPLHQVVVLTRYRQKAIKRLLRHAKYYSKYPAYSDILTFQKDFFQEYVKQGGSVIVPVPMHFLRKWKRGYNHTEKISQILWDMLDIPVYNNILKKKRYSKQQSHLSLLDRQRNLKNSYMCTKKISKIPKNSTIYLIDDIISTGSTLTEIVKTLQKEWFTDIRAIVLASD